eukprot:m.63416 g.63416  ORF g.63416 m.63416 type:complete len:78 (-) comp13969_c0_seq9:2383-2616(-)
MYSGMLTGMGTQKLQGQRQVCLARIDGLASCCISSYMHEATPSIVFESTRKSTSDTHDGSGGVAARVDRHASGYCPI